VPQLAGGAAPLGTDFAMAQKTGDIAPASQEILGLSSIYLG
jgi:hypothetical protein